MPMHISPSIDMDLSRTETVFPRMSPITNPLSPATQSDILGILQREQDRAITLLSSSPLLASLFVSYANQVAALESASATPSPKSEEWKDLQNTIATLEEEIKKLKSENLELTKGLELAEAFRSQVSSLKAINATQQDDIESLRVEFAEVKEKYDRLMVDSNVEKAALQIRVLDLEAQRAELKEAIVEQQIKISKLERQGFTSLSNLSIVATTTKVAYTRELDTPEDLSAAESEPSVLSAVDRNEAVVRCEKERNEKKAQEKKEREERNRNAWEKQEREEREEQERKEREEGVEKGRIEREARERAERETEEQAEREVKERAEKAARERADRAARRRTQKEAAMKTEQEAKENAEREAEERAEEARVNATIKVVTERAKREAREKAEQEARKKAEREAREREERDEKEGLEREEKERLEKEEKERIEREKEKAEREAKEKANREAKEREEEERKKKAPSKTPPTWGSTVGRNDRSRKTSSLSRKEQKNEWANAWDFGPTGKDETSGISPIITSSVPGGVFDGTSNFADIFATGKNDSPGGAEEVGLRTPLTKKGKKGIDNLSKVATPTEPADFGKLDILEDLNMNKVSARVSVSSENERFTDVEQGTSRESTPPDLAPGIASEALSSITSELVRAPEIKVVPKTPKPWSPPANPAQVLAPAPAPAETEPEKLLSLWDRKKLRMTTQTTPASNLFGGGGATNSSEVLGEADSGGGNTEPVAMPSLFGDRQSIFTDTARDQKRGNQRENLAEEFLGSDLARRGNDSAHPRMTAGSVTRSAPPPQKSGAWGSWGSSLLNNIASAVAVERSPSPEPLSVKPKIEDLPKGFTPNQPPKSQPTGFGSLNKPAWDNDGRGVVKTGPTPIAQNTSTGPAWGAKPIGSTPGPGGTPWGSGGGSSSGSGAGRNLIVDTTTKPLESSPNPAWLKSITECGDRKEGPIC